MRGFGKIDRHNLVLVVDPDLAALEATTQALEKVGLAVITATDGNQAIVRILKEPPKLLILELALPKRGGILLLEYLRVETETTFPIMVVTRHRGQRIKEYAELLGVSQYLIKPHDIDDVAVRATKILASAAGD